MGQLGNTKLKALLTTALAALACLAFTTTGAIASPVGSLEAEFGGDTAQYAAGQVEVPIECHGARTGFCSGSLTLTAQGKKSVSTFSVQGGGNETVFVPLPAQARTGRSKVAATVTTTQPLGPATVRKAILHLH